MRPVSRAAASDGGQSPHGGYEVGGSRPDALLLRRRTRPHQLRMHVQSVQRGVPRALVERAGSDPHQRPQKSVERGEHEPKCDVDE